MVDKVQEATEVEKDIEADQAAEEEDDTLESEEDTDEEEEEDDSVDEVEEDSSKEQKLYLASVAVSLCKFYSNDDRGVPKRSTLGCRITGGSPLFSI